ncbi:MAG: lysylphosphatidylglycerol synthase transmembrane domain-containing protein [Candidatus Hermodarchaeota archaeon]
MKREILARHAMRFIGILIFVALLSNVDLSLIVNLTTSVNPSIALLAVVLVIPIVFLKGARWYVLAKGLGIRLKMWEAVDGLCIAQMTSFTLPGALGDLVRVPYLKCRGNTTDRSLMSIFLDAVAASVVPYTITAVAVILLLDVDYLVALAMIVTGAVLIAAFYATYRMIRLILSPWLLRARIRRLKGRGISGELSAGIGTSLRSTGWKSVAMAILFAGGAWLLYTFQGFLLADALGIQLSWISVAMAVTVAAMLASLPISIQGVGVREGALLLTFGTMGVDAATIITFSLILMAVTLTPSLWGFMSWLRDPFVRINPDSLEEAILEPSAIVE